MRRVRNGFATVQPLRISSFSLWGRIRLRRAPSCRCGARAGRKRTALLLAPPPKGGECFAAFTLIELLVVVAIITVLLALLMPAMDKAVYQAELAACGARLDAIATGVTEYAAAFRRWYPYRDFSAGDRPEQPQYLGATREPGDHRPALRGYVSLKSYMDPLSIPIEIEQTPDYECSDHTHPANRPHGHSRRNLEYPRAGRQMIIWVAIIPGHN